MHTVEFYPKENAKESHTEEYDLVNNPDGATPIFRRGANFYCCLRLNRDFDETSDNLKIIFKIGKCYREFAVSQLLKKKNLALGPNPTVHRRTLIPLKLVPTGKRFPEDPKLWGLRLDRKVPNAHDLILQVEIAPDAPVGIWRCIINGKQVSK